MKKFLSFIFVLTSATALGQTAMFHVNLSLGDEQEQVMSYYPKDNPCKNQEIEIANKYIKEAFNSPLLKAVGIKDLENDVGTAIITNIEDSYNRSWSNPVFYRVRIFYHDEINKFLHRIIRSKQVKDFLFDFSCSIICDLCRLYPKDFKAKVINKLNSAINFVSTMKNHSYEAVDLNSWKGGELTLFIDGKENEKIALGIEGFLIRRVITDGFTVPELSNYLEKLLQKVKSVDISKNSDVLRSVNINGDLTYYTTATGNFYLANKTNVKVFPYTSEDWQCFGETLLQCIKDKNSNLYKISNGLLWNNQWELYTDPDIKGIIVIDDRGDVILRE